jgi:hypothetical protein
MTGRNAIYVRHDLAGNRNLGRKALSDEMILHVDDDERGARGIDRIVARKLTLPAEQALPDGFGNDITVHRAPLYSCRTRAEATLVPDTRQPGGFWPMAGANRSIAVDGGRPDRRTRQRSDRDQVGRTLAVLPFHRLQPEDVQHGRRRHVLEFGRLWDDVVRLPRAHQHRDILFAIRCIGNRRSIDASADIEAPQLF